ncbi:MAG: cysteine desulfurase [Candidatus Altiarchaeales archaeon]|nr:cysteine desulfurase [Candidatus Altiarchaeales archaeon]
MDVERIREDFPILEQGMIYMDSAASTLTPEPVLDSIVGYYRGYRANIHRGSYRISQTASDRYERARSTVAGFINADERELAFTKNTTEGINLIALSLGWKKGDKIVTTLLEHHSNLLPWLRLRRKGVELITIKPSYEGILDVGDFKDVIDDKTKLVAVGHISNVLGSIAPVEEIGEICKDKSCLFLVDGAQSAPHITVDVKKIRCDFFAFSAHKMLGPTGVGGLYMREDLVDELEPGVLGGGTVADVSMNGYELKKTSDRWEAGTPNIAGAIGFERAVNYLKDVGMDEIESHERRLVKKLVAGLGDMEGKGVEFYGPRTPDSRVGIVPFNVDGLEPDEVARLLEVKADIDVRSGDHCAMPLMRDVLGIEGSVRASLYVYNTLGEVEKFISAMEEIIGH